MDNYYEKNLKFPFGKIIGMIATGSSAIISLLLTIVAIVYFPDNNNLVTFLVAVMSASVAIFIFLWPMYNRDRKGFENQITKINSQKKELKDKIIELGVQLKGYEELISQEGRESVPSDFKSLFEWLYTRSDIIRTSQTFALTLEDIEDNGELAIKISGKHKYTINNSSNKPLHLSVKMKSELGLQSAGIGGFQRVVITLNGMSRELHGGMLDTHDKEPFIYENDLEPNQSIMFEFGTFGIFRHSDRFIWYSQDFCKDCLVTVHNRTTSLDVIKYQVNHHEEAKIKSQIIWDSEAKKDTIKFNYPIYPYEGFAMYWSRKSE